MNHIFQPEDYDMGVDDTISGVLAILERHLKQSQADLIDAGYAGNERGQFIHSCLIHLLETISGQVKGLQ